MKYNFKLFFRSFHKSLFKSKGTHARLTRKRVGFLILFYIIWPTWGLIVWFTFFLDHIFYRRFTHQKVEKPLFITGNFRSGSTYLQRLIAKDHKQFASARTWDIFLSPSVFLTKFFSSILAIDKLFNYPIKKALKKFDQRTLGQVDIHRVSFFEPEEDENFLLHLWSSYFGGILFPFMEDYQQYLFFDQAVNKNEKNSVMHFYKRVLQRFLYSRGGDHKLLSKNPSICPKIASIFETFPSARIIYLVRNPLEMLTSTISWLGYTWRIFSDPLTPYPFTEEILAFSKHWYAYPLKILDNTDPAKYLIIKYDDLVQNPQETIRNIYTHFEYVMSPEFERQIDEIVKESNNFRSHHHYGLENIGISRKRILTEFSEIFDRFGFDRNLEGVSAVRKDSTLD